MHSFLILFKIKCINTKVHIMSVQVLCFQTSVTSSQINHIINVPQSTALQLSTSASIHKWYCFHKLFNWTLFHGHLGSFQFFIMERIYSKYSYAFTFPLLGKGFCDTNFVGSMRVVKWFAKNRCHLNSRGWEEKGREKY